MKNRFLGAKSWIIYIVLVVPIFAETENSGLLSKDLYEDPESGQIYTKPGPGRVKIYSKESNTSQESKTSSEYPKIKLIGRIQVRSMAGQRESTYSNGHSDYNAWDTNFRRLRFGFNYLGEKWWGATLDIKAENLLNKPYLTNKTDTTIGADGKVKTFQKEVKINDNRGGIQEANLWVKAPFMNSKFYFGSHRLRFLREDISTSANLLLPERAYSVNFVHQWDTGIFGDIHPLELIDKKYTYYLKLTGSITSGKGTHEGYGRQSVLTDNRSGNEPFLITPMYSWRIEVNPFDGLLHNDKIVDWKEGEEIFQRNLKLSLGMSGLETKELRVVDSINTFTEGVPNFSPLVTQTTATGGDYDLFSIAAYNFTKGSTNPFRPSFGLSAHSYDFTGTWKGFYSNGALTYFSGSSAGRDTKTYHLTFGYIFPVKGFMLMPLVRYDFLKGDFDRNNKVDSDEIFKGYWVGLNLFRGSAHDLKVQLFYNVIGDRLKSEYQTRRNIDADNNIIYFQVQVSFGQGVKLN